MAKVDIYGKITGLETDQDIPHYTDLAKSTDYLLRATDFLHKDLLDQIKDLDETRKYERLKCFSTRAWMMGDTDWRHGRCSFSASKRQAARMAKLKGVLTTPKFLGGGEPVQFHLDQVMKASSIYWWLEGIDPIENAIQKASYISTLPDDWDEEGAKQISPAIFESATEFLREYARFTDSLPAPEINPCKDGTIDLSWRTEKARMLINIRILEDAPHAFYYGDRYNNKMPIKGNVPVNEFSESLAVWMKYLV